MTDTMNKEDILKQMEAAVIQAYAKLHEHLDETGISNRDFCMIFFEGYTTALVHVFGKENTIDRYEAMNH